MMGDPFVDILAVRLGGKRRNLGPQPHIHDCGGERCEDDQHFGGYHNDWEWVPRIRLSSRSGAVKVNLKKGKPMNI